MYKRIYSYIIILASSLFFIVSCTEDDEKIEKYTSNVDISNMYFADDKYFADLLFSVDDGQTYVDYPVLKVGQKYRVKVVTRDPDGHIDEFGHKIIAREITGCYNVDWSASKPAPNSVDPATGTAEFTMQTSNEVRATVTAPFNADEAAGTYTVVTDEWQDVAEGDQLTVEKIDDTHIQVVEYPATGTDHHPLVITVDPISGTATVEEQDSGKYGATLFTSGEGVVLSCGTIDLTLDFVYDGDAYDGYHLVLSK